MPTAFKYSDDISKKVKLLYPDQPFLYELALSNSTLLKSYLEGTYGSVPVSDILKATSLKQIQARARDEIQKKELHEQVIKEIGS